MPSRLILAYGGRVTSVNAEPVIRVIADTFEQQSGVVEALQAQGVAVEIRHLRVGDYELPSGVLVERKTVPDLHLSLERGRLWRQVGALRDASKLPYVLVEGHDLDRGSISTRAIRGACLAVIGQGVPIIFSRDPVDSSTWLSLLAMRAGGVSLGRDRPTYAQRLKSTPEFVPEAMLAAVPGISVMGARKLLSRFGSVTGVIAAGYDSWIEVPGIGPARASALERAIS